MRRNAFAPAFKLPLVKKTQARREESNDGSSFVHFFRKRGGGARFVVVFEKAGELVLIFRRGAEMLTHGPGMAFAEAVIEALVVGVIEALLLERPFQIPIDLGHETKTGNSFAHTANGVRPERRGAICPKCVQTLPAARAWPCRSARRRTGRRFSTTRRPWLSAWRDWRNSIAACPASLENTDRVRGRAANHHARA